MRFPTDGPNDWELTSEQMTTFCATYPTLDVAREFQKASLWLEVNPRKRKTARGMPRFLMNWLSRAAREKELRPRDPRVIPPAYHFDCPHQPQCLGRHACHVLKSLGR